MESWGCEDRKLSSVPRLLFVVQVWKCMNIIYSQFCGSLCFANCYFVIVCCCCCCFLFKIHELFLSGGSLLPSGLSLQQWDWNWQIQSYQLLFSTRTRAKCVLSVVETDANCCSKLLAKRATWFRQVRSVSHGEAVVRRKHEESEWRFFSLQFWDTSV